MENGIEKLLQQVRGLARSVARHRWRALGAGTFAALLGGLAVLAVPNRYEAMARIHVDTQTVLKPLMAGLTYEPDIDQQVAMLASTLISRTKMETLAQRPEFRDEAATDAGRDALVGRLLQKIRITSTAVANVYEIRYRGSSVADATRVVQATVDLFVHANAGSKKEDAREAGRFIESQIRAYETKLVDAEDRLKAFKLRNFGVTGVSDQDYFLRVARMGDEVEKQRTELAAAQKSRDSYRRELATEDPSLPTEAALRADSPEGRLAEQQRRLDDLLRRYTEAHPDVVIARRAIAELEAEIAQRQALEARGLLKPRAATSPVYQRLRVSLAEAEATVAALESQLAANRARLDAARSLAGRLPQAEAELAQLNRDYDVIRKSYDQMVARREAASLGERLDATAQLAEFRLIDPARAPTAPAFPSRVHLAWAAFAASIAIGVAAALLADLARPTFDDLRSVREFTGRPVLGAVSWHGVARPPRRGPAALGFAAAVAAVGVLQAAWVAWLGTAPGLG